MYVSFYHVVFVKFYCDVINRSRLQLISTSIDTFFSNSIHGMRYSFYHVVLLKFYFDVINRSRLRLINTLIDIFFSKLRAFLAEQRRRRKVNDGLKVAKWHSERIFSGSGNSQIQRNCTLPVKNLEGCT